MTPKGKIGKISDEELEELAQRLLTQGYGTTAQFLKILSKHVEIQWQQTKAENVKLGTALHSISLSLKNAINHLLTAVKIVDH